MITITYFYPVTWCLKSYILLRTKARVSPRAPVPSCISPIPLIETLVLEAVTFHLSKSCLHILAGKYYVDEFSFSHSCLWILRAILRGKWREIYGTSLKPSRGRPLWRKYLRNREWGGDQVINWKTIWSWYTLISNIKNSACKCITIMQGAVISIFVLPSFDVIGNKLPSSQGGFFWFVYLFLFDIHLSSGILNFWVIHLYFIEQSVLSITWLAVRKEPIICQDSAVDLMYTLGIQTLKKN